MIKRIRILAAGVVSLWISASASASTVVEQTFFEVGLPGGFNPQDTATLADFNVGNATKLVVTFGSEGSRAGRASVVSITFDGTPLDLVGTTDNGNKELGIYLLDNVTPNSQGDIVVNLTRPGSAGVGVLTIANALPGFSAASVQAGRDSGPVDISAGDLVVGTFLTNQTTDPIVPEAPSTVFYNVDNINSGGLANAGAYFTASSTGTDSFTFTGGTTEPIAGVVVFPAAESETFGLTITPAVPPAAGFDLQWESQAGKVYNLRSSADLVGPIADWTLVEGDIVATPPLNTRNVAQTPGMPRTFWAVEEFDAPPPPPLLSADFEADDGGFTVATVEGTDWAYGAPDSQGLGGTVDEGNNGSTNVWGTNLGTLSTATGPTAEESGFYVDRTETALRSPVIDLTSVAGAELTFAQALDIPVGDTAVVNLINATTDDIIAQVHDSLDTSDTQALWEAIGPIDLAAGVGQQVRLEWRFVGEGSDTDDYMGWYIDDVVVTETSP